MQIEKYGFRIICSSALDLFIFIFLLIFFNSISDFKINNILNLAILLWIFLSYIFGRYHDFRNINIKVIIQNTLKSLLLSLVLVINCFFLERLLIFNSFNINTIKDLSYFYFFYGLLSSVINLLFNFYFYKTKSNKKCFVLENNKLLKYLKDDNIESLDFLLNNLIIIENITDINTKDLDNISGIILEKNKVLNSEQEKIIMSIKAKGINPISNFEWCEKFLYRIPPNILVEELNTIIYPKANIFEQRIKKINEIIVSILILLFSSPVIILAAFLIYREDKGSIFYSQIRKGLYSKNIRIFKLRTMKLNSEKYGVQWSQQNDNRVTKIGYFLRKTRIDEIPQLISVLKGEMSLIGPRPERPEIDNDLKKNIPCYENRYNIKPGISGWAQVNYPYGASVQDSYNKLSYDLFYVRNCSIFIDLLILFKTIRVVIKYENASFNS